MPTNNNADLSNDQNEDRPLDARTPEGILPPERLADVAASTDSADTRMSDDPADAIPVPILMSPAEIDERAQAVEAVRSNRDLEPRTDV